MRKRHIIRGLMLATVVSAAVAALIVPAAFAGQPTIQRIPYEDHFRLRRADSRYRSTSPERPSISPTPMR